MITAIQRFCISLGYLNITLLPRISLQGISKVYSWKQKVPECNILHWWNVTSLGGKSDLTFDCNWDDRRRAWNMWATIQTILHWFFLTWQLNLNSLTSQRFNEMYKQGNSVIFRGKRIKGRFRQTRISFSKRNRLLSGGSATLSWLYLPGLKHCN